MKEAYNAISININCLTSTEVKHGNDKFIEGQIVMAAFIEAINAEQKNELKNLLDNKLAEIWKEQNPESVDFIDCFKN